MTLAYDLNATILPVPPAAPGLLCNGGQESSLVGGLVGAHARLVAQTCPDQPCQPAPGSCGRAIKVKVARLLELVGQGRRQTQVQD